MTREFGYASRTAPLPIWERQSCLGAATLESVVQVNEQVLALLGDQCRRGTAPFALIRDIGSLLLNLDAAAMRRAAASAVLLVDAEFANARLWADAIVGAVHDRPDRGVSAFFTGDGAVALMRLVVTHAWHLARSEPAAARLLLGLSAASLDVIGGCALSRLTQVAETRIEWLRPRWENRPRVWSNLLRTAGEGDRLAVQRLRVRGLQLLAADARPG